MIVTAIRAWPGKTETVDVELRSGATIADLRSEIQWSEVGVAVFGQKCAESQVLEDGDRVEFLRALTADPKDVRRRRAENNPLPRTFRMPKKIRQQLPADSEISGEAEQD